MAVVETLELADGMDGGASLESGGKYTRVFQVEFDAVNDDPVLAFLDASIPIYGAEYPSDSSAVVTEKTATPEADSNGRIWSVKVMYSRPSITADPADSPDPPGEDGEAGEGEPPDPIPSTKIQWSTWTETEAPQTDLDGELFKNSAGDLYDPPPTRENKNLQCVITRTQGTLDVNWLNNLNDCLNNTAFTLGGKEFAAKTLKVSISAEYPAGSSGGKWQVTITIQHKKNGWDWSILDAGYRQLVSGEPHHIIDAFGMRVSKPRPLDGSGFVLGAMDPPVYNSFRKHYVTDFAYLGLDY